MRLILNATFDGSALNGSIWATCFPWFRNQAAGCTNYKDTEYDWYVPSQVAVSGGALHLIAQPIATTGFTQTGAKKVYYCRSGMISSYPSLNFEYGYVEVVAQLSDGENMWNALWLSASNLKWPPEIDMVESLGPPFGGASMTFHAVGGGGALLHLPRPNVLPSGWHVFSVNWTPSSVTWFIDGRLYMTTRQNVPHQPMYFMANLARYTKFVTTPACSGTMSIRSVRVWQP
jgi:beta-glucanase (GH16 family)